MKRDGLPAAHAVNAKSSGQAVEHLATMTLGYLGCVDILAIHAKRLRYFVDYQTRQRRLGFSVKDDGDYLGLFDVIGWSPDATHRVQVKGSKKLDYPSAEWRAAVDRLCQAPGVLDEWWALESDGQAWRYWSRVPGRGWVEGRMTIRGAPLPEK